MMRFRHLPVSIGLTRRSEYRWVLTFAVAVMAATTIPYVLGYISEGAGWRFTGFVLSIEDGNAFIGKMLSGAMGEWLFRTPYTALPQSGLLIFLPYLLLGKLVAPVAAHDKLVILYHAFRFCAGMLAILATYAFLSFFVVQVRYRRLGLILATLGGGLGWLLILLGASNWLGSLPLDFYSPESFGFLSLYIYPHYALARALLLWGLLAYLKAVRRPAATRPIALTGLGLGTLWLLAGLVQPLTGMVVGAVVGIYLGALAAWQTWLKIRGRQVDWSRIRKTATLAGWAAVLPAPFVAYNLLSTRMNPFVKTWTEQSLFASPNPLHYLLAYGLIVPLAVLGGKQLWRQEDWTSKLPVVWALALPALAYTPISVQRRLPEGIWVALVVLAMKALELPASSKIRWSGVALFFLLPSTALLLIEGTAVALHPAEPAFRPADEVMTFQSLDGQTGRDVVALASYESGNALPAWAPVFVVVGHGPESVDLDKLLPRVEAFYAANTPNSERIKLLSDLSVDYVFWGPHERSLGEWDPRTCPFLTLFCRVGDYYVFAVDQTAF
jgi:hypothetical protein